MNGKAEPAWWQIFHNYEQRKGSAVTPNSFFAVRTRSGDSTQVRGIGNEFQNQHKKPENKKIIL